MIAETRENSHTQSEEARVMIFERTLREEATLLLFRALLTAEPAGDLYELQERAEAFAVIADDYDIPLEDVVKNWILFSRAGHERTRPAFVHWCEGVETLRRLALREQRVCPYCYAQAAERIGDRWLCPECGEVVL